MRKKGLLLLSVLFTAAVCFSQEKEGRLVHPVSKSTGSNVSKSLPGSSTLAEMYKSLEETSSHAEKADVYFWVSRFFADRLKIDSALFYSEKIKEESVMASYETGMAKHYLARSYALYYRGMTDAENLAKAIKIFEKQKNHFFSGLVYRQLARQYDRQDNVGGLRRSYHTAIKFLTSVQAEKELVRVYYEMGRSFYMSYEPDSSAFYIINSLQLAEKLNDSIRIFYANGFLGEVYTLAGDHNKAAKYFQRALSIRTAATNRVEVRNRLGSYAGCLMLLGEFDKAGAIIKEYELLNDKIGDAWGTINLHKTKGEYYFHRQDYREARKYLLLAYDRKDEIKNFDFDVKNIVNYLARTEYELAHYDSAITHLSYLMQLATRLKFGADLLDAHLYMSQAYEKKGNKDSAYHYFVLYDHLKDSLLSFQKEKAVIELATKYETEKKEQQIRLLQREKELDAYQLRSKNDAIEKQLLLDAKKSQQLALLSQQNEISRLEASEKTLAFENQQKEMIKKQNELALLGKEKELQEAIAGKESQRKNFAYIAIIAVLLFSGYVFFRYTQNKKLSRKLAVSLVELKQAQEQLIRTEKEKEAENIRVRISRDIHDEVGATLSGVALFSEIAKQKVEQHKETDAQVYLDHITANSKEMVEKMSDIVWTINPQNDSFERIMAKLQSYAFNLCAGKGIRLHIEMDDAIRYYSPSMQVRKNMYLLMKEAINNAVKYSGGENIFLSLQKRQDQINIEVTDDGKGFDPLMHYEGNGLVNMQARADELNGKLHIESQGGKGTHIHLRFNFHPAGGHQEVV